MKKQIHSYARSKKASDWLSDNFGHRFRYNALGDVQRKTIVSPEQSFGLQKVFRL